MDAVQMVIHVDWRTVQEMLVIAVVQHKFQKRLQPVVVNMFYEHLFFLLRDLQVIILISAMNISQSRVFYCLKLYNWFNKPFVHDSLIWKVITDSCLYKDKIRKQPIFVSPPHQHIKYICTFLSKFLSYRTETFRVS